MARGVRKTPLEKLEEELLETEGLIKQHSEIVSNLKTKKKGIEERIKIEKLNELSTLIEEKNMSIDDLRNIIESK